MLIPFLIKKTFLSKFLGKKKKRSFGKILFTSFLSAMNYTTNMVNLKLCQVLHVMFTPALSVTHCRPKSKKKHYKKEKKMAISNIAILSDVKSYQTNLLMAIESCSFLR